jgi:hypothetical protein
MPKSARNRPRKNVASYPHIAAPPTAHYRLAKIKRTSVRRTESPPPVNLPSITPTVIDLTINPPPAPDFDHPLRKLPEGDYGLLDVDYTNPFPPNITLPGSEDFKQRSDRCAKGYRVQPYKKPIRLGGITGLVVDGAAWAKKINVHLEEQSDALPTAPFIILIFGTIGSGKSALLKQLCEMYAHPDAFTTIRIVSPTAEMDPLMITLKAKRNPLVKFITDSVPDDAFFASLGTNVKALYAPFINLAEKGLYHRKESPSILKLKDRNRDFHDFDHPYLNSDGTPHGEKLRLYAHPSDSIPTSHDLYAANLTPIAAKRKKMLEMRSVPAKPKSAETQPSNLIPNPETLYQVDLSKPLDVSQTTPTRYIAQMNASHPHQLALNEQLLFQFNALHHPSDAKAVHPKSDPTLMVFDDCAYHFANSGRFMQLLTIIRHAQSSAIFACQKVTSVPPMLRALATNVFIFAVPNKRELKTLEDEFGSVIPDFLGAYHAATSGINGREKDFLNINMIKKTASRSFLGTLEPTDSCSPQTAPNH